MRVWSTIKTISANKKAFTLVELLVVIVILGILAVLGTVSVLSILNKTKEKVFEQEAVALINAARSKSAETIVPDEGLCYSIADLDSYVEKDLTGYSGSVYVSSDNNYTIWVSNDPYIINYGTNENMEVIKLSSFIDASESCPSSFLNITVNTNQGVYSGNIPTIVHEGQQVALPTPTKLGDTFVGWTVAGANSFISENILTVGTEDLILNANWLTNSYTLTINANGGIWNGTTPQTILSGGNSTVTNPTKANYAFTGWTVSGTGSTVVGTTFTMGTANTTLTANWVLSSCVLTVNANGGTWGGTTPQTININSSVTINNPYRSGYVFTGWTVSGTGSTMNGTTFTMGTANATLTANWLTYSSMFTYIVGGNPGVSGTDYIVIDDTNYNWRIKFLTSGIFTPLANLNTDIFLVGGGSSGGGSSNGGGGGSGGYTNTVSSVSLTANTAYTVTVGAGGNYAGDIRHDGFASYFAGLTAAGGLCATSSFATGGNGGSGGGRGGTSSTDTTGQAGAAYGNTAATGTGTGQGTTTCEFGQGTLSACNAGVTLYAGGGGGRNRLGGAGGGGNGYGQGDMHGDTNTGGGGGGGVNANVGVGGSGIVIIRNHR